MFRGLDIYPDWLEISDLPCTRMVGTDVGFLHACTPESRHECVGFVKGWERGEEEKKESYSGERMVRSQLGVPGEGRCIRAS